MKLHQSPFITNIVTKYKPTHAKPKKSPPQYHLPPVHEYVQTSDHEERVKKARAVVGSLLYVIRTRPDIYYHVLKASEQVLAPSDAFFQYVTRILAYLEFTRDYGLVYKCNVSDMESRNWLKIYSHASYSSDSNYKSTFSNLVYFDNYLVDWSIESGTTTDSSPAASEITSITNGLKLDLWLRNFFTFITQSTLPQSIHYTDSTSCRDALVHKESFTKTNRHYNVKLAYAIALQLLII